jgi:hypothetical protein
MWGDASRSSRMGERSGLCPWDPSQASEVSATEKERGTFPNGWPEAMGRRPLRKRGLLLLE